MVRMNTFLSISGNFPSTICGLGSRPFNYYVSYHHACCCSTVLRCHIERAVSCAGEIHFCPKDDYTQTYSWRAGLHTPLKATLTQNRESLLLYIKVKHEP